MEKTTLIQESKILSIFEETPLPKIQEIIESGFLADLRDGNVANANRDEIRLSLGLEPLTPAYKPLLKLLSTVNIPATTKQFVVSDQIATIRENVWKGWSISTRDDFNKWFFGKIEEPIAESMLCYARLRKDLVGRSTIAEIGGENKAETTLTEIFSLIVKQVNGDSGALSLNNSHVNIFFVRDIKGVLRIVHVGWVGGWGGGHGGWHVGAYSLEYPYKQSAGSQVFFHN